MKEKFDVIEQENKKLKEENDNHKKDNDNLNSASEIIKKLKDNNKDDNTVVNKIVKDLGDGRLVETIEIVTEEKVPII